MEHDLYKELMKMIGEERVLIRAHNFFKKEMGLVTPWKQTYN